jgi:PA14 domain-containing protein
LGAGAKFVGFPLNGGLGLSGNLGVSFNNKLGVALDAGLSPSLSISSKAGDPKTAALTFAAGLNVSSRNGASITPSISVKATKDDAEDGASTDLTLGTSYTYSSRLGVEGMHLDAGLSKSKGTDEENKTDGKFYQSESASLANLSSGISFLYPTVVPSVNDIFTRRNYSVVFSTGGEFGGVYLNGSIEGYYSENGIDPADTITYHQAYGMLYYQNGDNNPKAMLDFNRANDGVYTPNLPAIAIPVYTYDIFNITGEGTCGSFRATRSDLGYMHDEDVRTKDNSSALGLDLGFGDIAHGGLTFTQAFTPSEAGGWALNNFAKNVFNFQSNQGTYQAVYFRNPGEKTIPNASYQNSILGSENLVRLQLANIASGTPMLLPNLIQYDANKNQLGTISLTPSSAINTVRDKRTQVITVLTAEEATRVGFDKNIYSYNTNNCDSTDVHGVILGGCSGGAIQQFPRINSYRKAHHISEIDVLGTDGRKYIYGLPVYNTKQVDVSFNISNGSTSNGLSSYNPGTDDNTNNTQGRDWYMQQEQTPGYAHTFLLTALLSPNYVDVTGNGITSDDIGDAIKFNYTNYTNGYKWRTPCGANRASYSEGLKTDNKDDKAHYVYGEREEWLLYSIESKDMVARFYVSRDRKDGREVLGQSGGIDYGWGNCMKRLNKICLYSKADILNYGKNAKPIKTIQFYQSYKLCQNADNAIPGNGKLTLDSILITYNGNQKRANSKYVFYYPTSTQQNPDYDYTSNDRWGNYKPSANSVNDNPGSLNNADYPYSIQDKTKADTYAAAWTMDSILLPSGGKIHIDYESNDYAYVQNKRAASMCSVLGFGTAINSTPEPYLYPEGGGTQNSYVFIDISKFPIPDSKNAGQQQQDLATHYFQGVSQLYMKIAVGMPPTPGLRGIEMVPVYANIIQYGVVPGSNGNIAWVQVQPYADNSTPMVHMALQFIKQQLPGKAYPGYDVSDDKGAQSVVLALVGMLRSIGSLISGDDNTLMKSNTCRSIDVSKSFVRLTNPTYTKFGGGLRVKQITINDNWNAMTGQYESTYGQQYIYKTTEQINGQQTTISSGVASWEPSIGEDENPHKQIMQYVDHNKGGPYNYGGIEMPLGEVFYPVPEIGYSRVEVLSIHRDTVKNMPTRQVSEFYTTKDFPFKSSCTQLADPQANVMFSPSPILQLLNINCEKSITQSQGFLVEMNDMDGKTKSEATYTALDSINPITYTENYYNIQQQTDSTYSFNHNFQTLNQPDGVVTNSLIGRDVELMADFREHTTQTITTNIDPNFDLFTIGFIPFPIPITNLIRPTTYEGTMYRSASLLKIVNHYGMLDSVVTVDRGSMVSTKNMVYDAETGNPILTRTNNEHNHPIYNFTYPAHWAYSGMGSAYQNIDATYSNVTFRDGMIVNGPSNLIFESGDEIYVLSEHDKGPEETYPCDPVPGSNLTKSTAFRIWAVYTGKVGSATPQMVFMDSSGAPYTAIVDYMRIIRSGHRNMLDQMVGSVTSLNNPINPATNTLVFNDATNVLQTSAATFKDQWRVDNAFYAKNITVQQAEYARIKEMSFYPGATYNVHAGLIHTKWDPGSTGGGVEPYLYLWHHFTPSSCQLSSPLGCILSGPSYENFNRAYVRYDNLYNSLPQGAVFVDADLSLFSHTLHGFSKKNEGTTSPTLTYDVHPGAHPDEYSQTPGVLAQIQTLWGNWDNSDNTAWVSDYFQKTSNLSPIFCPVQEVPASDGPFGGDENFCLGCGTNATDDRIDVRLAVLSNLGSRLYANNQLGLQLSLFGTDPSTQSSSLGTYRCFWSNSNIPSYGYNPSTSNYPVLDYYYYVCGDTLCSNGVLSSGTNGGDELVVKGGQSSSGSSSSSTYSCTGPNPGGYNAENVFDPLINRLVLCGYQNVPEMLCPSIFTLPSINPYVQGIYGDWRVDTTYAYYGDRKEYDPNLQVDTRTGGGISNYQPFWNFNPAYLTRNLAASNVWVWNSTITQYNRKGYEIENKDPLGRFNSGLYGYDQELPTAVANNAREREIMYDGFEDYYYSTPQSCLTCQPHRHANFDNIAANIDSTQQHTGRYSLKVNAGQSITLEAPVVDSTIIDNTGYGSRIEVDSTIYYDTVVTAPVGHGLIGQYTEAIRNGTKSISQLDATINIQYDAPIYQGKRLVTQGQYAYGSDIPPQGFGPYNYDVVWKGYIQPVITGKYSFRITNGTSDYAQVYLNGTEIVYRNLQSGRNNPAPSLINSSSGITLLAGNAYYIEVHYQQEGILSSANTTCLLSWEDQSSGGSYVPIPESVLYQSSAVGGVIVNTTWCTQLGNTYVTGNALTDTFSLLKGKQMLLSAWVNENNSNCKCSSYVNNNITVSFPGTGVTTPAMQATGNIIEGWQRYEVPFTVPNNASTMQLSLNNLNSSGGLPVFFDDIRVEPFNSNLKSFVYNSSNLRLMSELDENNYATFYEYDDDGTLTRVKKETEQGIKTITETRSALQKLITQ